MTAEEAWNYVFGMIKIGEQTFEYDVVSLNVYCEVQKENMDIF